MERKSADLGISWAKKTSLDLGSPPIFVRPGPRLWALGSTFLSAPNLGLGPEILNFCPPPDLSSKGIFGGPDTSVISTPQSISLVNDDRQAISSSGLAVHREDPGRGRWRGMCVRAWRKAAMGREG